jgi:hypothetical protein
MLTLICNEQINGKSFSEKYSIDTVRGEVTDKLGGIEKASITESQISWVKAEMMFYEIDRIDGVLQITWSERSGLGGKVLSRGKCTKPGNKKF